MQSFYIELGKLIKEKRLEKKLSQNELAYRCMLHEHCIYKIENAKSEIKISTLIKIFKQLSLDFTDLNKLLN
ncbi:MAG: Helix-turn-helix domain [Burkholderiales bacterium]|jgi:transcriptional regulator with XRE-family HTH domain|nr:Helix-turn-helix domain [Burkholderiales bacterium]